MWRRLVQVAVAVNLFGAGAVVLARLLLKSRGGPESDELDLVTFFEGLHLRSHSSAFMGGSTLAVFGSIVLDLRRARLGPTGADVKVVTLFGGTGLIVPPDWQVDMHASTWAGGLDLSHQPPDDPDAPRLRVTARTVVGGLQVESRPRLEAVS